jgi:hypothetical protein
MCAAFAVSTAKPNTTTAKSILMSSSVVTTASLIIVSNEGFLSPGNRYQLTNSSTCDVYIPANVEVLITPKFFLKTPSVAMPGCLELGNGASMPVWVCSFNSVQSIGCSTSVGRYTMQYIPTGVGARFMIDFQGKDAIRHGWNQDRRRGDEG